MRKALIFVLSLVFAAAALAGPAMAGKQKPSSVTPVVSTSSSDNSVPTAKGSGGGRFRT